MDHGPAVELGVDNAQEKKAKLGVVLFVLYSIIYSVFVAITVFNYEAMGKIVFANLNLAVVFGFSLIIFAILLGVVYNFVCTGYENKYNKEEKI